MSQAPLDLRQVPTQEPSVDPLFVLLAQRHHVGRFPSQLDRRLVPARVHNPQVRPLETDWQRTEELEHEVPGGLVGCHLGPIATGWIILEPPVLRLVVIQQQVQVVVAQDALGPSRLDYFSYQPHHRRAVGSAIGQIADKDQPATVRVTPVPVITQDLAQTQQAIDLTMHITDDVQWPME